ncbi:hypothetical protein KCU93_g5538, partial [Aureobasidium melanogenum]
MGLASLKRHLSRALSHQDVETSVSDSANPTDTAQVDEQLQRHHQSSPKASMYQHSPAHSGNTVHNPEHASTDLTADVMVHVMTVGDSVITIETQREDEQLEQPAPKRRKRGLGLRRVKTAPPVSQTIPLHGSITTIESVSDSKRLRAWSYPMANWKKFSLVQRMRRGTDPKEARKEARRGKASCELNPESRPSNDVDGAQNSAHEPYPLMSGARQGSPSHVDLATDEMGISPRTSTDLGNRPPAWTRPRGSPTKPSTDSNSPIEDQAKRKDSHFHVVVQTKEQDSAEMEANAKEPPPDERPRKSSAFLLHAIDWIRQHRPSPVRSSSTSSSSSYSPLSSPVVQSARPVRHTQEIHAAQAQPAVSRLFKASSCDELCIQSQLNLPPGFEIPAEGQAGPVDWLHRGWEEHYRRSAESAHRACHPLAAAHSHPARNEDLQRYPVLSACQDGSQCIQTQRVKSIPCRPEHATQAWDFAVDHKGKGRRCEEDVGQEDGRGRYDIGGNTGAGHQRQRRRNSKGACVTTVTLGECNFARELGQVVA